MTHPLDQRHIPVEVGKHTLRTFKYEKYGIKGVGKYRQPIINMDEFIDHSMDEELHRECTIGLARSNEFKIGSFYGSIPPDQGTSWTDLYRFLDEHDPTGFHKESIRQIMDTVPQGEWHQTLYKYAYFSMGAAIPWYFALYLKFSNFFEKGTEGELTHSAQNFPKLMKYIETLPFKEVGRILFFTTFPNAGVTIHRDANVAEHKDHNINLFFTAGRPSFIWDEVKNEKIYLDPSARSYFFNNRDYHGVDPEPVFRYTLRIDGTFTDELQEKLGMDNGFTWRWNYEPK